MRARAFIFVFGAASLLVPLACAAAPYDADDALQVLQAGPRIIHVPQPPRSAPRRHVERPQNPSEVKPTAPQETAKPALPEAAKPVEREAAKPALPLEKAKPLLPRETAKSPELPQPLAPPEAGPLAPPEAAMPAPSKAPAEPRFRRPTQTKANRKISI